MSSASLTFFWPLQQNLWMAPALVGQLRACRTGISMEKQDETMLIREREAG